MMIGPAPMIMMDFMSVRLGIGGGTHSWNGMASTYDCVTKAGAVAFDESV
jgi:hypothetical protein